MKYDRGVVKGALKDAYSKLKITGQPAEIHDYRQNIVKVLTQDNIIAKLWKPQTYGLFYSRCGKFKISSEHWTDRLVISYAT